MPAVIIGGDRAARGRRRRVRARPGGVGRRARGHEAGAGRRAAAAAGRRRQPTDVAAWPAGTSAYTVVARARPPTRRARARRPPRPLSGGVPAGRARVGPLPDARPGNVAALRRPVRNAQRSGGGGDALRRRGIPGRRGACSSASRCRPRPASAYAATGHQRPRCSTACAVTASGSTDGRRHAVPERLDRGRHGARERTERVAALEHDADRHAELGRELAHARRERARTSRPRARTTRAGRRGARRSRPTRGRARAGTRARPGATTCCTSEHEGRARRSPAAPAG